MGLIGSIAGFGAKAGVGAYKAIGHTGRAAVVGGAIGAGAGAYYGRPGKRFERAMVGAGIGAVAGGAVGFGLVRPTANYLNFRKAMKGIGTTLEANAAKNSARDAVATARRSRVAGLRSKVRARNQARTARQYGAGNPYDVWGTGVRAEQEAANSAAISAKSAVRNQATDESWRMANQQSIRSQQLQSDWKYAHENRVNPKVSSSPVVNINTPPSRPVFGIREGGYDEYARQERLAVIDKRIAGRKVRDRFAKKFGISRANW